MPACGNKSQQGSIAPGLPQLAAVWAAPNAHQVHGTHLPLSPAFNAAAIAAAVVPQRQLLKQALALGYPHQHHGIAVHITTGAPAAEDVRMQPCLLAAG